MKRCLIASTRKRLVSKYEVVLVERHPKSTQTASGVRPSVRARISGNLT